MGPEATPKQCAGAPNDPRQCGKWNGDESSCKRLCDEYGDCDAVGMRLSKKPEHCVLYTGCKMNGKKQSWGFTFYTKSTTAAKKEKKEKKEQCPKPPKLEKLVCEPIKCNKANCKNLGGCKYDTNTEMCHMPRSYTMKQIPKGEAMDPGDVWDGTNVLKSNHGQRGVSNPNVAGDTSARRAKRGRKIHSNTCTKCHGSMSGKSTRHWGPTLFAMKFQKHADGRGACSFVGFDTQHSFNTRRPDFSSADEYGTKCTTSTDLSELKSSNGKLLPYKPVLRSKFCQSRKVVSLAAGDFMAECQFLKAVTCSKRLTDECAPDYGEKHKCRPHWKCKTRCEARSVVRCAKKCEVEADPSEDPIDCTHGEKAYSKMLHKLSDGPYKKVVNRKAGTRKVQKMRVKQETCTLDCSSDVVKLCSEAAEIE